MDEFVYVNTAVNGVLVKYMSMFDTIEDFSKYIAGGCYYMVSLTRVGYLFMKRQAGGGGGDTTEVDEYMEGLEAMYTVAAATATGGSHARKGKRTRRRRRHSRRHFWDF
jgi:hypothetical protein